MGLISKKFALKALEVTPPNRLLSPSLSALNGLLIGVLESSTVCISFITSGISSRHDLGPVSMRFFMGFGEIIDTITEFYPCGAFIGKMIRKVLNPQ